MFDSQTGRIMKMTLEKFEVLNKPLHGCSGVCRAFCINDIEVEATTGIRQDYTCINTSRLLPAVSGD
jgi:hypothetical protein